MCFINPVQPNQMAQIPWPCKPASSNKILKEDYSCIKYHIKSFYRATINESIISTSKLFFHLFPLKFVIFDVNSFKQHFIHYLSIMYKVALL